MSKIFNLFCVIGFCVIIFTPPTLSLLTSVGLNWASETADMGNEKRTRTAWPEIATFKRRVTDYTSEINGYFEDRVVFRKELLNLAVYARYRVLGLESDSEGIIGEAGWLFLRSGVVNAAGNTSVTDEQLYQWAENALKVKKRVEYSGGVFLIVVPPDKPQLYPEFMPKGIRYTRQHRLAEKLKPLLDQRGVVMLDLLDDMIAYKQHEPLPLLYSKTDTHWTHRGALHGYQKIIERLNDLGVELSAVNRDFLRVVQRESFSGDIAGLLGLTQFFEEPLEILLAKQSYKVFSPSKKLLVYGDSFNGRLIDFWKYSFRETYCYHHNIAKPNLDLIDEINADVVIFQIVERSLKYPLALDGQISKGCT